MVIYNQTITVTDLVVKRGGAQKTTAEYEIGATKYKDRSLFVAPVSCFVFIVVPRVRAPPGHRRARGQRSLGAGMVMVLLQLSTGEGVGVENWGWGSNDI